MDTDRPHTTPSIDHQGLEVIEVDECWSLIRAAPVGRVAFIEGGEPMVLPVNHAVVGHHVVFRTFRGSLRHEALMNEPVAFEVDGFDTSQRTGWSVLVRGMADLGEVEGAADDPGAANLQSWADAVDRDDWVHIQVEEISGRRIPPR